MKTFQVNKNIEIVCEAKSTRSGFKHTATLLYSDNEQESVKCCYVNRTWERYEYDTVLEKLARNSKILSENEKELLRNFVKNREIVEEKEINAKFKTVSNVMALSNIFTENQKDRND